ncbi:DUF309 domain-containing protein [Halopiger xanaduensis]|uniref:DUF309 domain-containing protein n=1 Tax=Halopiger xanaduensis (strain DSM 18323 / JCM 14033 / SH-6) TaxID=797210 RepID=F8D578_HALXS|nr:DUF309 domain-containing protein [Halopiger xanaduensis]AEH36435.1 protein of unknown function DUF309 [Halopiger xanaduensis SH-6]
MRNQLRAGAAIYNDGYYHAAHDAWEDRWLECEDGTDDERLLHGLIQLAAAVHHAHERNWVGAVGLAESAGEYLEGLPGDYRDLHLEPIRGYLGALAADPEVIERRPPVRLEHDGEVPRLSTLDLEATIVAAPVIADELGYDEDPIERACEYAQRDLAAGDDDSRFISLLFDFVREADARGIVFQRLSQHVDRRAARESDVEGLF